MEVSKSLWMEETRIKRGENVQGGEQVLVLCDGRDLHSLLRKVVTLATSQSPMGWLKLLA